MTTQICFRCLKLLKHEGIDHSERRAQAPINSDPFLLGRLFVCKELSFRIGENPGNHSSFSFCLIPTVLFFSLIIIRTFFLCMSFRNTLYIHLPALQGRQTCTRFACHKIDDQKENGVRMQVAGWGKALLCSISLPDASRVLLAQRNRTENRSFRIVQTYTWVVPLWNWNVCGIVRSFCGSHVLYNFSVIFAAYLGSCSSYQRTHGWEEFSWHVPVFSWVQ